MQQKLRFIGASSMPGTMLRTVHTYFIQFSQLSEVDTLIIPVLLTGKLRPREVSGELGLLPITPHFSGKNDNAIWDIMRNEP